MYRETIEHPWSIPDDIKAQLDLRSGYDRGRIYRLAPPGFRPRPTPRLSRATTAELVALLEHPNAWHRDTAHRLLFERQDTAAVEPLRRLLRRSPEPLGRLHALWSLEGLKSLGDEDLLVALDDAAPGVREHAVRLAEPRLDRAGPLRDRVLALADAPEARVRFQVAFTLGEVDDPAAIDALARIARRDAGDPWIRTAVLSSAWRNPLALWERLLAAEGGQADPSLRDEPGRPRLAPHARLRRRCPGHPARGRSRHRRGCLRPRMEPPRPRWSSPCRSPTASGAAATSCPACPWTGRKGSRPPPGWTP